MPKTYYIYIYITAIETDLTCAVEKWSTSTLFKMVASRFKCVFNHGGPKGTLAGPTGPKKSMSTSTVVVVLKWCIPHKVIRIGGITWNHHKPMGFWGCHMLPSGTQVFRANWIDAAGVAVVDSRCSTNVMSWSISVVQPWQWNSRSSPRFTLRCWKKLSNLKRKEYNRLITKNTLILDDLKCYISVGYFASTRGFEFLRADQGASKQFLAGWTCWSEGTRKNWGSSNRPDFMVSGLMENTYLCRTACKVLGKPHTFHIFSPSNDRL